MESFVDEIERRARLRRGGSQDPAKNTVTWMKGVSLQVCKE
jgi:hypothetical protein